MIYVASPLFSEMERDYINKVVDIVSKRLKLSSLDDFYIPHRDNKYNENYESEIYDHNIEYLNRCDIMIAILDGKDVDSGTAFEIGYFTTSDKPILGLLTDKRSYENGGLNLKLNTMMFGSCKYGLMIFSDLDDLIDEFDVQYRILNKTFFDKDSPLVIEYDPDIYLPRYPNTGD